MLRTVRSTGNSVEVEAEFGKGTYAGSIDVFEEKRNGRSLLHVKITAGPGVEIGIFEVGEDPDGNAVGITTLHLK